MALCDDARRSFPAPRPNRALTKRDIVRLLVRLPRLSALEAAMSNLDDALTPNRLQRSEISPRTESSPLAGILTTLSAS